MKILIVFVSTLLLLNLSNCISQQHNSSEEQKIAILTNFFTQYLNEIASSNQPVLTEHRLDSLKKIYCTTNLLNEIPKLIEQTETDPIIKAQDSNRGNAKTLSIRKEPGKTDTYDVSYVDEYDKLVRTIHLTVTDENGLIKISSLW